MEKKKRIAAIVILSIVTIALILGILAVFIYYFSRANLNFEYDEMLFSSSIGSNVTEYYVNSGDKPEEYDPILYFSSEPEGKKLWYSYNEYPKTLLSGFLALEDREFFTHKGVNIRRTFLAAINSVFHMKPAFGASTITQQLIKNISGDSEVTFKRKLNEIIRAVELEKKHSKEEIFELYLNIVPMGENTVGIGSASLQYFGKEPRELSIAECALLIGITNAPTRYNPHTNAEAAREKRDEVLYVMRETEVISEEEYEIAVNEPISVLPPHKNTDTVYPWFIESVNEDLYNCFTKKLNISPEIAIRLIESGGLRIYTTMNKRVQDTLDRYFENPVFLPREVSEGLELSAVICDSKNGDLLGIYGSAGKKQANRLLNLARTNRPPGSAIKPISLYAPLIDSGRISWSSVVDDVPISFDGGKAYPKNYPNVYAGLTNIKDALRLSKNTVAIKLYDMLGAENIYYHLTEDFGFSSLVRRTTDVNGRVLSDLAPSPLALGQLSFGLTLEELTHAYTVFPAEGELYEQRSFVSVYDNSGRLIYENEPQAKRVYKKESARLMTKLLSEVVDSGTASAVTLDDRVDTAGKTGTSGDDFDRWFIGFTPYVTAGIWVGYPEGSRAIGKISRTHISLWDAIMNDIHTVSSEFSGGDAVRSFSTQGLVKKSYCKDSGKLYSDKCLYDMRGSRLEEGYFIRGSEPIGLCDRHIPVYYDRVEGAVAGRLCPRENLSIVSLVRVEDRAFPREVIISDAEYVYRKMSRDARYAENELTPYFYFEIKDGVYVGRSRSEKQFNRYCKAHN